MRISWKLGRVAGIDLFLHPTFLLLLIFAAVSGGGFWAVALTVAVFVCVLLHEFGHALTARGFGIETEDITIYPIGGLARLRRMPRSPKAELLITLAGPAVNVVIAAALASVLMLVLAVGSGPSGALIASAVGQLMWINVGLAVFNMLPIFPMDGGRVLRAGLSAWLGRVRATEIAVTLGRVLAVVLGVAFFMAFGLSIQLLLPVFLYIAAGAERNGVLAEERHRQGPSAGVWTAPPGYHWVNRGSGAWQLVAVQDSPHQSWN
ncbi:MAG: site-2 protease family protein [Isosphaeraceae bacterium]